MRKNKILSGFVSLLLAVSMIAALIPAPVGAASPLGDPDTLAALRKINYLKKVYKTPEEKLATMTKAVENDRYALYVQEYTAEVAVMDTVTGQLLFTNPWDVADSPHGDSVGEQLLSQIILRYKDREGSPENLNSYTSAAKLDQIVIKSIRNGIRVEYTIGAAAKRRIVPHTIEKSRFEELILKPIYEATTNSDATFEEFLALRGSTDTSDKEKLKAIENQSFTFYQFYEFYTLYDLSDPNLTARVQESIVEAYPAAETMALYVLDEGKGQQKINTLENDFIKKYTKYSLDDLLYDHEMTLYEEETTSPPVFRMALEYTLEDGGFQVRLPARGISYDSTMYTLDSIQVLPYFGAGRVAKDEDAVRNDDGYNFVPDGSGAVIDFRQKTSGTLYSGVMYGADYGFYSMDSAATASYQIWRAPVYGTVMEETIASTTEVEKEVEVDGEIQTVTETVVNDPIKRRQGYVAFMTEGESLARIDASFGGISHEYCAASTTYFARQTDSYPLDGITVSGGSASVTKAIERRYVGNYTVKYRFLWEDQADYVGMANAYREYLIKEGILRSEVNSEENAALYLDLLGDIDTTEQILGVPVSKKAALTTFEDAATIMNELTDAGIKNQILRYLGWMNGGMASTIPSKMDVESALGGKKGLQKLVESVQSSGNQIFMDFDFSYVDTVKLFDGFDESRDTAKTIDGKAAFYKTYNPVMQAYNSQVAYVIAAQRIQPLFNKISKSYGELFGNGKKDISVGTLGTALSSNQDEDYAMNREDTKSYVSAALAAIAGEYDQVMVEGGNVYTWRYAEHLLDIPLDSSNRNNATAEVPFLGILLHGYKSYTGNAINLAGDYNYNILKTVESGADPYFVLAYRNTALLKTNGYGAYYAVDYKTWKDSIIEEYNRINEAMKTVKGQTIVKHEIFDNRVVKVTYSNGVAFYLNYNNFDVSVGGIEIRAMDFVVR